MKKYIVSLLFLSFVFSLSARPKVALVLGGGGARGLAEIPVLEAIEEEGIPIDLVIGTSFGSILGALYSSGYSPSEARKILTDMDYMKLFAQKTVEEKRLLPEAFEPRQDNYSSFEFSKHGIGAAPGVLGDNRINTYFCNYFSRVQDIEDFDKLPIPFRAIATNASNGEVMVIGSGSLNTAVRASMSIPLVWEPYPVEDYYALDGGIVCNIPVSVAKDLGADIVIAFDVSTHTYMDPKVITGMDSVGMQMFMLVVGKDNEVQHSQADIVFTPDLHEHTAADFLHVKEIISIGEQCVEQNKPALHELAMKMQEMGVVLEPKNPERKGIINTFEDSVIESVSVRDISLMEKCPLPLPKDFDAFVGKKLDSEVKTVLEEKLEKLREKYHLTTLVYVPRKGSEEGKINLEIQANHYHHTLSKVFLGGDSSIVVGQSEQDQITRTRLVPDITTGVYIAEPFEMIAKTRFSEGIEAAFNLYPVFKESERGVKGCFDIGTRLEYGSLAPESNLLNKKRNVAEDNGFGLNLGIRGSYLDLVQTTGGLDLEVISLYKDRKNFAPVNLVFESIFDSLENKMSGMSGIRMMMKGNAGMDMADLFQNITPELNYAFIMDWSNRWAFVKNRFSAGFDFTAGINRNNSRLRNGYYEYGGLNGLCGSPNGNLKRDVILGGITCQYKLAEFAGMPFLGILKMNAGAANSHNPFISSDAPGVVPFDGCSKVDFGGALYLGLKTLGGTLLLGGGLNTTGQWSVTLAFN